MTTRGYPFEMLMKMREKYPISMHGVSMSIGSADGVSKEYLKKLKELISIVNPFLVSDHLCWTGRNENNLHNLLPLKYDEETLRALTARIGFVQEELQRNICIENLSAYFSLKSSSYTEWEFLNELANRSGCKLLLDINNVYVNSVNQKFDPLSFLNGISDKNIGEIHLAGFSDMGDYLFDTHSKPVFSEVWDLFDNKIRNLPEVPILIEWDEDIPEFPVLEAEAIKARSIRGKYHD